MKPIKILLYADGDLAKNRVGTGVPYAEFFSQFGEVVLVTSQNDLEFFAEIGDVLAVPGGLDVYADNYNTAPSFSATRSNPHYEYLDSKLLPMFIEAGKPIVGICRGAQAINIALGGTLYQNIFGNAQYQSRDDTTQTMYTFEEGFKRVPINTFHHQSVKDLADDLELLGWSQTFVNCPSLSKSSLSRIIYDKTGKPSNNPYPAIIEAYKSKNTSTLNIVGFQYHPEEFNCSFARKEIRKLLTRAGMVNSIPNSTQFTLET